MSHLKLPVPTWLDETYIETALKKYYKEPDLKVNKMDITPGSKIGDNYVCLILRIRLVLDIKGETKDLSIIGKLQPFTETVKAMAGQFDVFGCEATVFEKVLPAMKEELKGVKGAKKFAPECFHIDRENLLILMEDLGEYGLEMPKRQEDCTKEQAILVMEALATMHGASYRVVQKEPSLKETFKLGMLGSNPSEMTEKWFRNGFDVLDKIVDSFGFSEDWCRRIQDVGKRVKKESLKCCDFQEDRINVLQHADCWKNNMLFHFTDGVPDDVILFDFQVVTYNSFTHDLNYFLFSSVDPDVLVSDLDLLLEAYFNKLKAVAPEIPNLTLERVKKEFNESLFMGCVLVLIFRAFIWSPEPPDMDILLSGRLDEMGFNDPKYIADLKKLLPLMEQAGVF